MLNNAGTVRDRTLMRMSEQEFDEVIAVNLLGKWACSKAAALAMQESGGHILNVISGSASTGPSGQSNYAAVKAGVASMMRCWVFELDRYGIRSNCHWPLARTDITEVIVERNRALDPPARDPHHRTRELVARRTRTRLLRHRGARAADDLQGREARLAVGAAHAGPSHSQRSREPRDYHGSTQGLRSSSCVHALRDCACSIQ